MCYEHSTEKLKYSYVLQFIHKYFAPHDMIISGNDNEIISGISGNFLYYKTNQISLCCIILGNGVLGPN